MAAEIVIPQLGMTMTEGSVAEWYVSEGADVVKGDLLFRVETEKIEVDVEAEASGTVRGLLPAGTTLEPGGVVGYILAEGEVLPSLAATSALRAQPQAGGANGTAAPAKGEWVKASPAARRLAVELGVAIETVAASGPGGRIIEEDVTRAAAAPRATPPQPTAPAAAATPAGEVLASPLARRLAAELGLDLGSVAGTGPGGRITKEDVEAAAAAPRAAAATPQPVTPPATVAGGTIALRGMRKVIAERMHASLRDMAQLTMGMDVGMDEAIRLRTQLVEEWAPEGIRPTYTDLVLRAVAKALRLHPILNATVGEQEIVLNDAVHVGMAVAVDDGLVVPVIRDADRCSLKEIAAESTRLAEAARSRTLPLDAMAGGTFSVTSLGASGVDFFTPIINPPNVAILGVGQIRDAVAWDGDRPVRARRLTLSLTIDHRAVDGAPGAAFLGTVRDLLQSPYRLLV